MKLITDSQAASFKAFADAHECFIIAAHKEPDADGLASCLALASLVRRLGKSALLFSAGPFKRAEIRVWEKLFPKNLPDFFPAGIDGTGLIVADCAERERLGEINLDLDRLDMFIIDHHRTSDAAENAIIDPTAPSTTTLVQQLYEKILPGAMPPDIAQLLLFGLATDTGFFRFLPPQAGDVFRAVGRLADCGAEPRRVYDDMHGGKPFSTRKLLGLMLERAEQKFGGRLIYTYETAQDTQRLGQQGRDSDSLYQLFLSVDKVEAVLFVREETEKKCTAALRSRGDIDVSAIAAKYGGGGHKNAAGMSTEASLQSLSTALLAEFKKALFPKQGAK